MSAPARKYEPSVSIIIPTWRDPAVLERCLRSLEELDYPKDKLEIILVSQGSADPRASSDDV